MNSTIFLNEGPDLAETTALSKEQIEQIKKELDEFTVPSTVIATGWSDDICPVATAIGRHNMEPDTLIIERCSKLKVEHNGIEIEFPLDSNILKSINTIEINGFKYVKEN